MRALLRMLVLALLAAALSAGFAQSPPPPQKYVYHYEWTRGAHLTPAEWARARQIQSWRVHLPAPPPGYTWREIDRNYVLASLSHHTILRVVAAPH